MRRILSPSPGPSRRTGRGRAWPAALLLLSLLLPGTTASGRTVEAPAAAGETGPSEALSENRSLDPERMQAMVREYLDIQRQRLPREAEIRFMPERPPQGCSLPPGDLAWDVIPSHPNVFSSSSFSLIVRVDGRTVCNRVVRGRLEAMALLAVSVRTLSRDKVITAEDIRMSRQDILRQRQPFLHSEDLVGRIATRTIPAGVVIEARDVMQPPLIKKGDLVKLMTGGENYQLSTAAVAVMDAAEAAVILVRNINSNKIIHGRVIGPGLVTVEH